MPSQARPVGSPNGDMRGVGAGLRSRIESSSSPAVPGQPASRRAVAWIPNGDMERPTWIREGRLIGAVGRGSPWWIGDWLLYGTAMGWGERYSEAAKITGYDAKSLRNMRYVSSRFDSSLRRDNLTWSHHVLVAAAEPDEQKYWLDRAAADKFSVDDLRVELRGARRSSRPSSDEARDVGEVPVRGEVPVGARALTCPHCGREVPLPQYGSHSEARLAA